LSNEVGPEGRSSAELSRKRYTETLKAQALPIWEDIYRHPFLTEAKAGTLPLAKFRYYVIQDYHYLSAFARVVAIVMAKAPNSSSLELIGRRLVTPVERPLHRKLMPMLDIKDEDLIGTPISPTNLAYCNHMISAASLGSWATGIAALLPCPWTYHELGEVVGKIDHPVFGPWSSVYAEGLLEEGVNLWRDLLDEVGKGASHEEREAIMEAFVISSRYEYMFWEMAYRRERWPV
jgi:thiaminase/transcriptional activator TenA